MKRIYKILADVVDWDFTFAPTHIMGKEKFIHVYLVKINEQFTSEGYGIAINENDYDKIDHTKSYIIIHDPFVEKNNFEKVKNQFKDKIIDVKDVKSMNRAHIHIGINVDNKH